MRAQALPPGKDVSMMAVEVGTYARFSNITPEFSLRAERRLIRMMTAPRTARAGFGVAATAALAAGCTTVAAPAAPVPAPMPTWSARQATIDGCRALAR